MSSYTQNIKKKIWPIGVGLAITFFHLYWMNTSNPLLIEIRQRLDWIVYDLRLYYSISESEEVSEDIVIIDIDERSLTEQGRWPWSRLKMATLIDKLREGRVIVTALDIVFAEPEQNPASAVIDYIENAGLTDSLSALYEAEKKLDADDALVEAIKRGVVERDDGLLDSDVVTGFLFINDGDSKGGKPKPVDALSPVPPRAWGIKSARGYVSNLEAITEASQGSGFYSVQEDDDGTLRRYSMLFEHNHELYPSLALETLRRYWLVDQIELNGEQTATGAALESISVGNLDIPLDQYGRMLIPFSGRSGAFDYVSATDVIEGRLEADQLEGKIAFIGSTAKALFDFRSTPVQAQFPGLEVHPTIVQGILDNRIKQQPWWGDGINLVLILFTGVLFALMLPFFNPAIAIATSLGYLVLYGVFNIWAWTSLDISLEAVLIVSLVLMQTLGVFAYGFVSERFARLQVTDMFGQYVPPALVSQMSDSPQSALSFDGDRRDMTVMFADIRDFTSISEGMEPAELKDMLNRYFTPMTKIIFENKGTIDKYIGDMVMAFWGAPINDGQHADNALSAAMHMLEETEKLQIKFQHLGYPAIQIGVGLNSGDMNVGNMGSEYRRSYTVLGDNVNLGSRIEGLTKYYGVKLLVGDNTYQHCRTEWTFCPIDKVRVKGKEEPVMLYEPLGRNGEVSPETLFELESYQEALEAYYEGYWEDAHRQFFILSKLNPDRQLYQVYAERTQDPSLTPESGWDGVFTHVSK